MTNRKIKENIKTEESKANSAGNKLLRGSNIVQGILWHEILSEPLCKRRRNK